MKLAPPLCAGFDDAPTMTNRAAGAGHSTAKVLLAVMLSCAASAASANGFFIPQQSVVNLGRAGAGAAAAADDVSTAFYNPAGLPALWKDANPTGTTGTPGVRLAIGANLIDYRAEIRNEGSTSISTNNPGVSSVDGRTGDDPIARAYIPNVFIADEFLDGQLYLGMAVTAPFGLSSEYSHDSFVRYDTREAALRTINTSFVVAHRFANGISFGGGLDVQRAKAVLMSALPSPIGAPSAATDGSFDFRGNDVSFGYNLGITVPVYSHLRLGIHYRSEVDHTFNGSEQFRLPTTLGGKKVRHRARADFNLPSILTIGAVYDIKPVRLYVNAGWYDWSTLQEIVIKSPTFPDGPRKVGLRDGFDVAFGLEYDFMPTRTTLRSGVKYDSTPTRDATRSSTFPDASRVWLGIGLSQPIGKHCVVDMAFNHVFFEDTTIDVSSPMPYGAAGAVISRTRASVSSRVNTFALDFNFVF